MIYRFTLAAIAAVFFGVAAQSANAAISAGERPLAQEMEHGIAQPSYDGGTTTPPSSETEPEAVESVPAPVEQGISTSPGVAPVTEPELPAYESNEKDEEGSEEGSNEAVCESAAEAVQWGLDMVSMLESVARAVPDLAASERIEQLTDYVASAIEAEYEFGCYSDGETAE